MQFTISVQDLINTICIAAGIGICGLNFLQISSAKNVREDIRHYFQAFFTLLLLYITSHLARQYMDGLPGGGVGLALGVVTLVEMLAAGVMTFMMSLLMAGFAYEGKPPKRLALLLNGLVLLHALIVVANLFGGFVYFFDAANVYHRGPAYLLSNLCPLAMLIINMVLLSRHPDSFSDRVRTAFWIYTVAPIVAIAIQSFSYGIQFIMIATVAAAAYMFLVITREQADRFERQKMESSRLETELSVAARIQANMLPNIFPAFPDRDEFDIFASMRAAKEVGGDFYDFFFVDENHLGIVMADVSGKGVPAALFMMISKILVQNNAMAGKSPREVLMDTNDQICANNPEDMFVTVWFGLLDLTNGRLVAANAGHEYPALKPAEGTFDLFKDPHGMVIGGMEGMPYREYELTLEPGAMLFLYTDGVPEATDAKNELFGNERMIGALREAENGTPEDVLAHMDQAVSAFVGTEPQFDDLTMLCIRYVGKGA